MPRQPEGRLVQKILDYCRGRGGRWVKIHGGDNPYQEVGIADILGCYRGFFVALEVKQPGGEASRKQELFLRSIEKAGGFAAVVESLDDVIEVLNRVDRTYVTS